MNLNCRKTNGTIVRVIVGKNMHSGLDYMRTFSEGFDVDALIPKTVRRGFFYFLANNIQH